MKTEMGKQQGSIVYEEINPGGTQDSRKNPILWNRDIILWVDFGK